MMKILIKMLFRSVAFAGIFSSLLSACATIPPETMTKVQSLSVLLGQPPAKVDRQAILAMAGNYKVKFDFTETVSFQKNMS